MWEIRATGRDALALATELLQRARRADRQAGLWEAADVQWRWRKPRRSDNVEQLFWVDTEGPVAGVLLTSWTDDAWQCDPIIVPRVSSLEREVVWTRALEEIGGHAVGGFEVLVRDDDLALKEFVERSGLVAGKCGGIAWMDAADRSSVQSPAAGFALIDRTQRRGTPHPMRHRNGDGVEERLGQVSLYDPELDLAVEAANGRVAGYSLSWFDPATKVGLVEPVRVEVEYQRRGLARAMLTAGIERLATKGAQRVKIGFETEAAAALYQSIGFQPTSTDTLYEQRFE
ncbi:MAG: GNAT family N-acetyltransferase [Actinomycetota bacterium]|nr:GNAT family N-acetyltransferase [Actinomycetota bacterium]